MLACVQSQCQQRPKQERTREMVASTHCSGVVLFVNHYKERIKDGAHICKCADAERFILLLASCMCACFLIILLFIRAK